MVAVLVVEDDVRLADALRGALLTRGFDVRLVATGRDALAAEPFDVALVDLGLPDVDGLDVVRGLRRRHDTARAGIIVVTARGQVPERVAGLRAGADDYVVKPLGIEELVARIEAVLRRTGPPEAESVTVGGLHLDLAARRVSVDGGEVALTPKEYDLLVALVREQGAVATRERLMLQVWQTTWPATQRTLEVHVASLRAKLGDPDLVQTVRGVGYRLAAPDGG